MYFWKTCLYKVLNDFNLTYYSSIILGSFSILLFPKLCWHIGLTPILECHIRSSDRQCHGKHVTKFSSCTRSSNMDKEALLRRRRELYRQRRERETPEEREVRSRRREYYRQLAYPGSRAHNFSPSCVHACILRLAS